MTSLKLSKEKEDFLRKKHYGVWNHSAVQICSWTKKALLNEGTCYKNRFYGADTHSCMEMTPTVLWCQQNCIFCWRPMEFMKNIEMKNDEVDEPEDIINHLKEERKKLLSGFWGNEKVDKELLKDAIDPTHYAISLSGEPTLYPKLNEMVKYLKTLDRTKTIFIVTNGQEVDYFKKLLNDEEAQPTQLYLSLDAPNEELFKKVNVPIYKDGWQRLNKTLELFSKLKCRKVVRFTMIKGLNDKEEYLKDYKNLFEKTQTDFIEVKAYMHLGLSRKRLTKENMPSHKEVKEYAKKIEKVLDNYKIVDEVEESRIVLLYNKNSKHKIKIEKFENEK